ncbi:Gfo/Idh/MocA family oxidoreductase [Acidobacteriota bacterium]
MAKLNFGIVGMSEGNGHPYSWSAICNGYNRDHMINCPFPAIPDYLSKQSFPEDSLGLLGEVTHIWTQERKISEHIAASSKISTIVERLEDMISHIDAILLARDDAENHYRMALPFLRAGIPIFIDKPLALSVREANKILDSQKSQDQIYTCSALRFARELMLTDSDLIELGEVRLIEGSVMKKWETYGVHLIEPIVAQFADRGKLLKVESYNGNGLKQVLIRWQNLRTYLKVTGSIFVPLELTFYGTKGVINRKFFDSFNCFKYSLEHFIGLIHGTQENIKKEETLEIVKIIELGI